MFPFFSPFWIEGGPESKREADEDEENDFPGFGHFKGSELEEEGENEQDDPHGDEENYFTAGETSVVVHY